MEKCDEGSKKQKSNSLKWWFSDDRYKAWIREVPDNRKLFFCVFCNNTYSSSSSHVRRHSESLSHKKASNQEKIPSSPNKQYKKKFLHKWLEEESFKPWLREVQGDPYACFCKICCTKFACSLSHIRRHKNTALHIKKSANYDNTVDEENKGASPTVEDCKASIESAEIRFAALIEKHNIPFSKAELILNFFKNMANDPNVLLSMKMDRTKCRNIVFNAMGPEVLLRRRRLNGPQAKKLKNLEKKQ